MKEPVQKRVLITGGSGLTGRRLSRFLRDKGWDVVTLSHSRKKAEQPGVYYWSITENKIDDRALDGVTHLIHLAGAGISDKRWSKKYKHEIIDSRVLTAGLLYNAVIKEDNTVRCYISASAIGIYGNDTSSRIHTEETVPGTGFLAETCRLWEKSADMFSSTGVRTIKIRTGIVLACEGGFMKKIATMARFGLFAWFGNGRQLLPWIHIDDLCAIYHKALTDENMEGPYNAVAPEHITQKEFMLAYAARVGKPALKAGIPSILVRVALGDMSEMLLQGSRVSSAALESAGFVFRYRTAEDALRGSISSYL